MRIEYSIDYISEEYIYLISKLYQLNLYSTDAVMIAQDICNKLGVEGFSTKLMNMYGVGAICEALQQIKDKEKAKIFLEEMYKVYPDLLQGTIAVYVILLNSSGWVSYIEPTIKKYKELYGETELLLRAELDYLFNKGYEQNIQRIEAIISQLKINN